MTGVQTCALPISEELVKLGSAFAQAGPLFRQVATQTPMVEFLTLPGYAALA